MNARPSAADLIAPIALAAYAGLLLTAEARRPLRQPTRPKLARAGRNLAVAGIAGAIVSLLERPVVEPAARLVGRRRWGLLPRLGLPRTLETALAVALMDYTLYVWHVLMHRVPFLWRTHLPHHVDLDLDATTAVRFHFAELVLSIPLRLAQVVLIGVGPRAFSLWQGFTIASILFHHSNVRLPRRVDEVVGWFVTTPRMHGIHHSTVREETNSNWSSGLSLWDRLHGTLRRDVPQAAIEIGVPAYRDPEELTLRKVLALPFGPQRPSWTGPTPAR